MSKKKSCKFIAEIKNNVHWNALEFVLQNIAHDKAQKGGHANPSRVSNSFKFGALLCDNKKDFKIRAVPVNSNFSDSKPTAMITTGELFDYLMGRAFADTTRRGDTTIEATNSSRRENIIWVMDMLWFLIESKGRGVKHLGGELKEHRDRSYYSNFQPEILISKRYSKLYPSKKWIRERLEAKRNDWEGIDEQTKEEYEKFEPQNPMNISCDIQYPHDYEKIQAMPKYKRRKNLPAEREWRNLHINFCLRTEILKLRNKMEELCLIG